MGLVEHAERELRLAGLFDKDSDYGGMLGESTMKLIRVFSEEGHSGMSASIQSDIFNRLSRYKNLTPLTDSPDEWMEVGTDTTWQNKRCSDCFSTDGGKTYYSIDDEKRTIKTSKPTGSQPTE